MSKVTKYDVYFNDIGFMLDDTGASEVASIVTPLADKIVTGEHSYGDYDIYSILAQSSFQAGVGQHDLSETNAFKWGQNMDSRANRLVLGPKVRSQKPTSLDPTGSTGLLDVNGLTLNHALVKEPEDLELEWRTLDATRIRFAVPMTVGETLPGPGTPIDPSTIPSLEYWWSADDGVFSDTGASTPANDGDRVRVWRDKEGSLDRTTPNVTMSPFYRTNETPNGHAAVESDGVDDRMVSNGDTAVAGSTPRTLILVVKPKAAGDSFDNMYCNGDLASGNGAVFNVATEPSVKVSGGNMVFNESLGTTDYVIFTMTCDGSDVASVLGYLNGTAMTQKSVDAQALNTQGGSRFFSRLNGANNEAFSAIYLADCLCFSSVLSQSEREGVEAWIANYHGIDIGQVPGGDYGLRHAYAYIRSRTDLDNSAFNFVVYDDDAGKPGSLVAGSESDMVAISDITWDGYWVQGIWSSGYTPPTGDHWLVFQISGAFQAGEFVEIGVAKDNDIADGYYVFDGTNWVSGGGYACMLTTAFEAEGPTMPVIEFVEFKGSGARAHVYAAAGRRLYRILDMDTSEVMAYTFAADITDITLVRKSDEPDNKLLIAQGQGNPMIYYNGDYESPVFSEVRFVSTDPVDADRIHAFDGLYWRSGYDATVGVYIQASREFDDWNTAVGPKEPVGDSRYPIVDIFDWKGQLYVAKVDGLYGVAYGDTYPDEGTATSGQIVSLATAIHPNNFRARTVWQNNLYFSVGHGLARLTASNVFDDVNPTTTLIEKGRERGIFTDLYPTLNQMFCAYSSRRNDWSQIMTYDGAWHSIATSDRAGDPLDGIYVDSGLYGEFSRVWYSSFNIITSFAEVTESLERFRYASDESDSPIKFWHKQDPDGNLMPGRTYISNFSGTLENIDKHWLDIDIMVDDVDVTHYIEALFRTSDADPWTSIGYVNDMSESDVIQLSFPENTVSREIQLRFDFYTTANHLTPVMRGYALRYVNRPDVKERTELQLVVGQNLVLQNGAHEQQTVSQQLANVRELRRDKGSVLYVDEDGTEMRVHIDSVTKQRIGTYRWNARELKRAYVVSVGFVEA